MGEPPAVPAGFVFAVVAGPPGHFAAVDHRGYTLAFVQVRTHDYDDRAAIRRLIDLACDEVPLYERPPDWLPD